MIDFLKKRLTYANAAATLALLFAMSGGAYAANHFLITSTKQISPKVLKALKGNNGANGANGVNGAAGAQGPAGGAGPQGPQGPGGNEGPTGTPGKNGTNGTNGTNGAPGPQGPLQPGKSEGGEWSISVFSKTIEVRIATLSFNVPLAAALDETKVHFIKPNENPPEPACKGSVEKPEAASGNLCVFTKEMQNLKEYSSKTIQGFEGTGADKYGARILLLTEAEGETAADGTWVVTG
jgi:hypothetical protein